MQFNMNIKLEIDENITLEQLGYISKKMYNKHDFLITGLANKLGIYDVRSTKRKNHISIYNDSDICLYINEGTSITEVLSDFNNIQVDLEDRRHYNPEKAGVFKDYLDKVFDIEEKIDIEKILGEE